MTNPRNRLIDGGDRAGRAPARSRDHHDRQAEVPCGGNLAVGRGTAAVLRHHHVDAMRDEQASLGSGIEGAALQQAQRARYRLSRIDRIDAAHDVAVLRMLPEGHQFLTSDGEEDRARALAETCGCLGHAASRDPVVAVDRLPRRALENDQRHARHIGRPARVGGNPGRVGMSGVDQQVDALIAQKLRKAFDTAEASDTQASRLSQRAGGAPRQRQGHVEVAARNETFGKLARLAGAAEYQDRGDAHERI